MASKEIDYAYNALGQFTSIAYYNMLSGPRSDVATGAFTYDTGNRITGLAYTSNGGSTTIDTFGWGYNAGNLVTSFSSIDGTASYTYNSVDELTAASYTTSSGGHQPSNESYSFDANGNRNSTGYSTGSANLMTSDGTFNYQHDADGNQTVRTRISNSYATDYKTTYSWDYRNRLTDVEYFDNSSVLTKHVHYVYDVFDHLIATEADTTGSGSYNQVEHYALGVRPEVPVAGMPNNEPAQPVLKFDGSGNLTGRNLVALNPAHVDAVMAQGSVSSTSSADVVLWLATDNQGTPRDVVNNSGAVANHLVDTSTGQIAYQSASSVVVWAGFGGGHDDLYTGLVIDFNRWYDPSTGRFENQDPSGFAGGDANLSRYAFNSDPNGIDPSGLGFWSTVGWTVAGAAFAAATVAVVIVAAPLIVPAIAAGITIASGGITTGAAAIATAEVIAPVLLTTIAAVGTAHAIVGAGNGIVTGNFDEAGWNVGMLAGGFGAAHFMQGFDTSLMRAWVRFWSGSCFTAGTNVLVPSEDGTGLAQPGHESTELRSESRPQIELLWSSLLVGLGLVGYAASRAKAAADEERKRDAALRALFGDDSDDLEVEHEPWSMDPEDKHQYERDVDALCDALFDGEDIWHVGADLCRESAGPHQRGGTALVPQQRWQESPAVAARPDVSMRHPRSQRGRRRAPTRRIVRTRLGGVWLAACLVLAAWFGVRPPAAPDRPTSTSTVARDVIAPREHATRAIEDIRVGERVLGENPHLAESEHTTRTAVDPVTWRLVRLHAEGRWEDGTLDTVEVETLQPLSWIAENRAQVGRLVPMPVDITEMGMPEDLRATVLSIEPCAPISDGPGHLVTSTINHLNRFICELSIEGTAGHREPIKATGYHKFYSDTRGGWVSASELRRGERLRGFDGPLTVAEIHRVPGVERVYNFSVEGEHVYHVSALGALVHNPGCGPNGPIINLGGEGEVPGGNVINVQPGRIGGDVNLGLQNATRVQQQSGQPVVMAEGNNLPFANGSASEVVVNNVPIDQGTGHFGPSFTSSEINRIVAPGGTISGNAAPLVQPPGAD